MGVLPKSAGRETDQDLRKGFQRSNLFKDIFNWLRLTLFQSNKTALW